MLKSLRALLFLTVKLAGNGLLVLAVFAGQVTVTQNYVFLLLRLLSDAAVQQTKGRESTKS